MTILLQILAFLAKIPGALQALWAWLRANPVRALVLGLGLALLWTGCRLHSSRQGLATAEQARDSAVAWAERLQTDLDAQNEALTEWRAKAEAAQAQAARLRAQADKAYQIELDRARELLERPKDPVGCPEAWDRLFQALEGTRYQEAP